MITVKKGYAFAITLITILCAAIWFQPSSEGKPTPTDADAFRQELGEFFAELATYSPTVLGGLAQDADTLIAIRENIRQMTPGELASIQKTFAAVPNWRLVPEMMATAVPPETLQGMQITVRHAAAQAARLREQPTEEIAELRELQGELESLYALARLLPPETLERVNLDQPTLTRAQQKIQRVAPAQWIQVRQRLDNSEGWQAARGNLPKTVPAGLRRGAAALARTGEISVEQSAQLDDLRLELETFLSDAESLSATTGRAIDQDTVSRLRQTLSTSTPEAMFVLREEIESPQLRRAMREARMLASADSMSAQEREQLHQFRDVMIDAVRVPLGSARALENLDALQARYAESTDAEMLLLRQRVARVPDWNENVPAVLEAAASLSVADLVEEVLSAGTVEPDRLAEILSFREHLLYFYSEQIRFLEGPQAERFARAEASLENANIIMLSVMHEAHLRATEAAGDAGPSLYGLADLQFALDELTPEVYLAAGIIGPSCSIPGISIPQLCAPAITIPYVGSTQICLPSVSTPSINLDSICDAIFSPLNFALQGIESVIDSVGGVAGDIATTLVGIVSNIDQLPGIVGGFLVDALESILDLTPFGDFYDFASGNFNLGALSNALNIGANFWQSIPSIPAPPCPADGTMIPLIGEVGDSAASANFNRYLFIFDKILQMIPETTVSLPIKITAQVLYAGVQYLGVCYECAADLRDDADTAVFRATAAAQFAALQAAIVDVNSGLGMAQSGIDLQAATTTSALSALDAQIVSLQSDIDGRSSQLTSADVAVTDRLGETTQMLLQLEIEAKLLASDADYVTSLVLPASFGGYIETVRQIVADTIARNQAAGLNVHGAVAALQQGDDWLQLENYVNAYGQYSKAYREAVRK